MTAQLTVGNAFYAMHDQNGWGPLDGDYLSRLRAKWAGLKPDGSLWERVYAPAFKAGDYVATTRGKELFGTVIQVTADNYAQLRLSAGGFLWILTDDVRAVEAL